MFILENSNDKDLSYKIVVNVDRMITLPNNLLHYSNVTIGEYEIYEVEAYSNGILLFELYDCIGGASLQAYCSLDNLRNSNNDVKFETVASNYFNFTFNN